MPKHTAGFVYVLSNPAMPGMVKVGRTRKLTESRGKELQTTGVPTAFSVEFRALTSTPEAVEAAAHHILADYRVSSARESRSGRERAETVVQARVRASAESKRRQRW